MSVAFCQKILIQTDAQELLSRPTAALPAVDEVVSLAVPTVFDLDVRAANQFTTTYMFCAEQDVTL